MAYVERMDMGRPRAIPILTTNKRGKIDVDVDALTQIFRQPKVQDKPISIVSVSGAFRKGKSFILNFFLRYLRGSGYENPDWMGEEDEPLDDGFEWRGGCDACTNGILMWSEVFIEKKNGEEVAILLMDTQGLFDNKSDNKTNSVIFALSTLISSVQIFNLTQQIQESDLMFLQFFTAYAEAARKASCDKRLKPFQSLIFLVRDWPYAEEIEYGMDGGDEYLAKVLSDNTTSEELSTVRKYLRSSFDRVKCCLMPHPGLKVATTAKSFKGCLRDIDPDFLKHTKNFVDHLFQPRNLIVKTINGQVVSAHSILQYIVDCSASLTDGKLPNPKTMMENVAEAQNFEAQNRCHEKYQDTMNEVLGNTFVDGEFLRDMHEQALVGAMQEFADKTRFGGEESRRKHRDYLQTTIQREFEMLVEVNRGKRMKAESKMFEFIPVLVDSYEKNMKGATEEVEFLPDNELEKIHSSFADEAYKAYYADKTVEPKLKDRFFEKLQSRIERVYAEIKRENDEKRRIAEEQNEMEKSLLKLELETSIKYRNEMRQLVENYTEESELKHASDRFQRNAMDEYKIHALDAGASPGSTMLQEHEESLDQKLKEEQKQVESINAEKKVALDKALESQCQKAYVAYDEVFKKLLKNSYMEKSDLRQKHEEVVSELMNNLRSLFRSDAGIPLVVDRLQRANEALDNKYSMIEKWNEKNNTFLRKCFKVAKAVVRPFVAVFRSFRKLF